MSIQLIAEESTKITDVVEGTPNTFWKFLDVISSSISNGIFVSPPFSLENAFPTVNLFKNKYFKLFSIVAIYLGLLIVLLTSFKPKNTRNMFLVYSICFWIVAMIFSIIIINPYDENSVEYMLRDKVNLISSAKEILEESSDKPSDKEKMELTKGPGNTFLKLAPDSDVQMVVNADGKPLQDSDGYVLIMGGKDGKTVVNDIGDTFSISKDGKIEKNIVKQDASSTPAKPPAKTNDIPVLDTITEQQSALQNMISSFL
jgi:hypothetical protein